MKKTVNINLGGKAFIIDEDAYTEMERYLNAIERHFSKSEGFEDIMDDIEVRIAELLEEDESGGQIVSLKKIENVKAIMGKPQDFGSTDEDLETQEQKSNNDKRLFRNPEEKVIAGVASGLAAYFGIKDPVLIRICFVIAGVTSIGILVYMILWMVVPYAKTSSDFLSMKGVKINIDNIAKSVEDGFLELKDTIEELTDDFKSNMTK